MRAYLVRGKRADVVAEELESSESETLFIPKSQSVEPEWFEPGRNARDRCGTRRLAGSEDVW